MPQPRLRKPSSKASDLQLLTVRIDLIGAEPPIWRRLELRSDLTLDKVHALVQAAFEWDNGHLHEFAVRTPRGRVVRRRFNAGGNALFGITDLNDPDDTPEEDATLAEALPSGRDWLVYTYDFGDTWEHRVKLERSVPADAGTPLAHLVDGERAAPPEDFGGIWMYNSLVEVIQQPEHPGYEEMMERLEWMLGDEEELDFDPETFDLATIQRRINRAVETGFRSWWVE